MHMSISRRILGTRDVLMSKVDCMTTRDTDTKRVLINRVDCPLKCDSPICTSQNILACLYQARSLEPSNACGLGSI